MLRNINSFTLGARSVNPKATTTVIFTGDWSMPVKEAEAANSLIDQGVDVADHARRLAQGHRRDRRATAASIVTGYHANQAALAPKGYLTGAEWNWGKVYTDYVTMVQTGKPYPHLLRGGLKEGFVKMSPYGKAVSAATKKKADAAKAKFMAGTMVIYKGPLKDNTGKVVIPAGVRGEADRHRAREDGLPGRRRRREDSLIATGCTRWGSRVTIGALPQPGTEAAAVVKTVATTAPRADRWRRRSSPSPSRSARSSSRCCCSAFSWRSPGAARWPSTARCFAARSAPGSRSRTRCSARRR